MGLVNSYLYNPTWHSRQGSCWKLSNPSINFVSEFNLPTSLCRWVYAEHFTSWGGVYQLYRGGWSGHIRLQDFQHNWSGRLWWSLTNSTYSLAYKLWSPINWLGPSHVSIRGLQENWTNKGCFTTWRVQWDYREPLLEESRLNKWGESSEIAS